MKKLAVLAVAGLMSVTASAANWVLVQQGDSGTDYVDTDSITSIYLDHSNYSKANSRKSYKQAFFMRNFSKPRYLNPNTTFTSRINLHQFDCESNPKKSRSISILAQKNSYPVASYNYNEADWNIVYPGSLENMAIDYVCSYQK